MSEHVRRDHIGVLVREEAREERHEDEDRHEDDTDRGLPVGPDRLGDAVRRAPAARRADPDSRLGKPGRGDGNCHGYPAVLVRGSSIAVAMSESRIAMSTLTVMIRNSPCMRG